MSDIKIERSHSLGRAEARKRVGTAVDSIVARLALYATRTGGQ